MLISQLKELQNNLDTLLQNDELLQNIENTIKEISRALSSNLPVLVFGNGGSASDALHISAELVGKFRKNRKAMNVVCLNSNVSVLTAWANDFDFNTVYSRQIEAHGRPNGICLGISTSGNSVSVVKGFETAKNMGMVNVALTGNDGGQLKQYASILLNVPSTDTPRIQELHLPIYHYICERVEYVQDQE